MPGLFTAVELSLVLDISGDRASTELFKIKQQFIQIFPTFWIQMFAWFLWFYTYMLLSSTKVFVLNNIMWLFCVTWKYTYDSKNSICITANRLLNLSRYVYSFYMFLEYLPLWKSADVHVTYYVLHVCVCVCVSRSVMSDCLLPPGLQPTRLFCPWNSPGKSPGLGCHFLLQRTIPTQCSNPGLLSLLYCRQILWCLNNQGKPQLSSIVTWSVFTGKLYNTIYSEKSAILC